ncbi:MAG: hypothetical protein ACTSQF_11870 [Candidatus Heimdallarchaeaceae archaeon]
MTNPDQSGEENVISKSPSLDENKRLKLFNLLYFFIYSAIIIGLFIYGFIELRGSIPIEITAIIPPIISSVLAIFSVIIGLKKIQKLISKEEEEPHSKLLVISGIIYLILSITAVIVILIMRASPAI